MRTAQDFDPVDIINVEHGALRTVEIDVVDIDADTGFKTGNRVLLANAANEGGQRRIGATGHFQGDVRRGVGDGDNVQRAHALEIFTGHGRHRKRHVLQRFLAAAGGDGDDVTAFRRTIVLGDGGCRNQG